MEGQVETGSERRTLSTSTACSENHSEEIRSEREDIAAEGIGEAIEIANNNDEIEELLVGEEQSSVSRNALSLVQENLLGIDEANDNQTREAIEEEGFFLEFIETNNDDDDEVEYSDDDYETERTVDDEIAEILATDNFDTRSVNDEVAERLATDFPHLIAEQSEERQNTEEVLRRHIGRTRQFVAAYDAHEEREYRRSLGMDIGPEQYPENYEEEMWLEGRDVADDELIQRDQAIIELWEESSLELDALIQRAKRRRIKLALRTICISEHHINNNTITSSCTICQIDFKLDEEASQVQCGHLYHPPCLSEWLGFNHTCPACRFEM